MTGAGRVAALDLGTVRTGVALSDPDRVIAAPLDVVPSGELTVYLRDLFASQTVDEVVVGVPKTLAGEVGPQASGVLDTIARLRREFPGVRFVEWDERLTTRMAVAGGSRKAGKKKGRRPPVDHLAAARILQEYLARRGDL
ncbi:Holliday junction resolvase RuvX [Rubrobacter tropicus]|uniref:Putative pre-16S rRNA nuclease n=1 Tax=Rubrobacter tropicus TaxID=2653851 RepID=A0A6G8Q912_9ACTN|nr:Holliday junction resolvase RuvX [Rubrobacter tropicus]QIN82922.1 Holliday junction resolvase RuvX [Rubrobacter tropicus]